MNRPTRPPTGGTADDLRRNNLARLLKIVHRSGGLPRAELTRRTGLNRSTVGACLADLVALGDVVEGSPAATPRKGRPSPLITPSPDIVAVTVNPEVDAITVGLVGLGGRVLERWRMETSADLTVREVVTRSAGAISALLAGRTLAVAGVAVAVPGQVRRSDGQVRDAVHLGWREEPLAVELERATGLPTKAANAASLGMYGESAFGAGRGIDDLVYFIGGASGIGGGVITGGQVVRGASGYGGELGHFMVRSEGRKCPCGARGCLEIEVTQRELLDCVGLLPHQVDRLDEALAASDDPAVRAVVRRDLELLGVAVRNAVNVFNPGRLVLGGFLASLHRHRPADDALGADAIRSSFESLTVATAELGADQLTIGTAELAFSDLLADPAGHRPVRVGAPTG
ncbi:ROK family protein [Streptomyces sp. DSM 44915]|uniref:ROK family protein n=1 Tax=Streptomyces chisholmiae TaxID=3075540 RepID=A0ABU2JTK2_9ACTN|nr:ROK family protein [Streptomyces sp. DSM 44915]MDT0267518.1 ROK family protein [Streptomyces sp. DSM 44915]